MRLDNYFVVVDYGKSVEDGVRDGCYNWVNPNITSHNFPTTRNGKATIEIKLIHFNRCVTTNEAFYELGMIDYRPADLHELLALGEKYPDVQREFLVIALDSVCCDFDGCRIVPAIYVDGSDRILNLYWIGSVWYETYRFAAVKMR